MTMCPSLLKTSQIFLCILLLVLSAGTVCRAQGAPEESAVDAEAVAVAKPALQPGYFYAIAGLMAIGCLAAGFAVGKIGAAVMGAAAEKPEIMGKAIAFVGLGEGIALFAFLVCLMLLMKL